ncbi:hypothetical protein ACS0TY_002957 [Phlomoides rotata]
MIILKLTAIKNEHQEKQLKDITGTIINKDISKFSDQITKYGVDFSREPFSRGLHHSHISFLLRGGAQMAMEAKFTLLSILPSTLCA